MGKTDAQQTKEYCERKKAQKPKKKVKSRAEICRDYNARKKALQTSSVVHNQLSVSRSNTNNSLIDLAVPLNTAFVIL